MRALPVASLIRFHFVVAGAFAAAATAVWCVSQLPGLGAFNPLIASVFGAIVLAAAGILLGRMLSRAGSLPDGPIVAGTEADRRWHLWLLVLLFFVNPLIRSSFLPLLVQRWVYQLCGARWGRNTFCSGVVLDPPHVKVGANSLLGQGCVVYAHVIENDRLELCRVVIGDNVTVGAGAIVMPGCRIGDEAIIAAGSVLKKQAVVEPGEVWGGVPARRLRSAASSPIRSPARTLQEAA